jgi:F0F1-type ATP synthase membrane subunit b/b'
MEKAALQKILEAEKKADEIISEGVRKAREISEKSALEIKGLRVEFEELLDKEVSKIIDQKVKEAEMEAEKLEASFVKECAEIKEKASFNIDKAIDYVIDRVGSGKWQ